jgi:hypothetical protein
MIASDGEALAASLAYISAKGQANALHVGRIKVVAYDATDIIFPKDLGIHHPLPTTCVVALRGCIPSGKDGLDLCAYAKLLLCSEGTVW